jgi:O-antigen ligase
MHKIKKSTDTNLVSIILYTAFFITLFIFPTITDPINSPKFWALIIMSSILAPSIFRNLKTSQIDNELKLYYLLLLALAISLVISAVFSENKYRALFGESQRRNGLLTYLGFIVIAAVASRVNILEKVSDFARIIFIGTSILTTYGVAQSFGFDFIAWSNPYSPVIGTLGNPNFMAATCSVLSILVLPILFLKGIRSPFKVATGTLLLGLFVSIYYTKASQGILLFIFGIVAYLLCILYFNNKLLSLIGFTLFGFSVLLAVLGILQRGPLADLLYKNSVSLRGYYWDAGIKMFFDKPVFGIGLDSYGIFFNQYRSVEYPLKFGYFVSSNNAHNLPIQLLATGGILVGLFYGALIIYVLLIALKKFRAMTSNHRVVLCGLVISFICCQLQSLVSIDNIGVGIWSWVIAGFIIGFDKKYLEHSKVQNSFSKSNRNRNTSTAPPVLASWIFGLSALTLAGFLYQGEKRSYELDSFLLSSNTLAPEIVNFTKDTLNTALIEPNYKSLIADRLFFRDYPEFAIEIVTGLISNDPNNLSYLNLRANFQEAMSNYQPAIADRNRIAVLNPYNAHNYKVLVELYIKTSQIEKAQAILQKVRAFAAGTEIMREIEASISNSELSK